MKKTRQSLAIVILAITVGCTKQNSVPEPPPATTEVLQVYTTADTQQLATLITENNPITTDTILLTARTSNHQTLLSQLDNQEIDYFLSHHAPNDSLTYWFAPLLQDGVAIIIHKDNPLGTISSTQLRRIYRGFITNWAELGGEDAEIIVYSREVGAGIRLEFDRLVMGQEQTTPNAQVLSSSASIIEQIMNEQHGIAYIPVSLLDARVDTLAIDTIIPSQDTIADNTYPFRLNIYAIGLQTPKSAYQELFSWIQNLEDDALQGRYVPLPR